MTDNQPKQPRKPKNSASPKPAASPALAPAAVSESAAGQADPTSLVVPPVTSPGSGGPGEALLTGAAVPEGDPDARDAAFIRIKAKVDGYRRGGIAHPAEWTTHPLDVFKPEEVEAILADPDLFVEFS